MHRSAQRFGLIGTNTRPGLYEDFFTSIVEMAQSRVATSSSASRHLNGWGLESHEPPTSLFPLSSIKNSGLTRSKAGRGGIFGNHEPDLAFRSVGIHEGHGRTPGEIPACCRHAISGLKMTNPYMAPRGTDGSEVIEFRATERPHAELIERKFLYRKVRITSPIDAILEYSGFSLHDRIWVNHRLMVCRLPWIWLTDLFKFDVQTDVGLMELQVRLGFHRFAQLKEFEIAVGGQIVYREHATAGTAVKGPKS